MTETCRKSFQYKLDPTPEQLEKLDWTLWRCRELYNAALEERKEAWRMRRVSLTYYDQQNQLPAIKEVRPEYRDIHTHVLQDVVRRLDKAMHAFFRRVKAGEKPGYPRFQSRARYHSFTYGEYGNGARLDGGVLSLSKIGRVAIRLHRPLEGTPKTVTISKEADGWYACLSCAEVPIQPLPLTGQETGVDVGLKSFLSLADGTFIENPRHYRIAEKALKRAQRKVTRRKQGSNRRRKAVQVLAKRHQKLSRQRRDFHHKTALALVRQYDVISHGAIQSKNLSARPKPVSDGNGAISTMEPAAKRALINRSLTLAGGSF